MVSKFKPWNPAMNDQESEAYLRDYLLCTDVEHPYFGYGMIVWYGHLLNGLDDDMASIQFDSTKDVLSVSIEELLKAKNGWEFDPGEREDMQRVCGPYIDHFAKRKQADPALWEKRILARKKLALNPDSAEVAVL